jgi:hypothetical protein
VAATDQHPADEHSDDEHSAAVTAHGSTADEPSAEWGWHGELPRAGYIAGWFTVIALFAMMINNHTTGVENAWLISIGTILALMLIGSSVNRLRARRR